MANTIKPKRSYTLSSVPSGLAAGELAVNASATPKVWIGNSGGTGNVLIASLSLSDMAGSTSNITEGTNLYYTDARARAAVSAGAGITYSSSTGVITADAASANSASKLVIRDASGNFSAGTITANLTGNSATATKSTNIIGGNSTTLLGAIPYQSNTDTTSLLSPNTTTTKNFLSQTGTGTNGAAPSWSAVSKSDVGLGSVENTALSTWAGSANITTTGTITTGTWNSSTKIGLAYGGTNANITATNGGVIYSTASALAVTAAGTSGQLLQSNGAAAPSWVASPGVPTGSLFPYAGSAAPTGYLLCDGSAVSRTTYATLFGVLSTTYGSGDGSTTFNLPDLRGRLPLGAGTGVGLNASGTGKPSGTAQTARTAGQWGGEETHLLTSAEMPQHNHTGVTGYMSANASHAHTLQNLASSTGSSVYNIQDRIGANNTTLYTNYTNTDHYHTIPYDGSSSRHATMPPFIVANYIIKT